MLLKDRRNNDIVHSRDNLNWNMTLYQFTRQLPLFFFDPLPTASRIKCKPRYHPQRSALTGLALCQQKQQLMMFRPWNQKITVCVSWRLDGTALSTFHASTAMRHRGCWPATLWVENNTICTLVCQITGKGYRNLLLWVSYTMLIHAHCCRKDSRLFRMNYTGSAKTCSFTSTFSDQLYWFAQNYMFIHVTCWALWRPSSHRIHACPADSGKFTIIMYNNSILNIAADGHQTSFWFQFLLHFLWTQWESNNFWKVGTDLLHAPAHLYICRLKCLPGGERMWTLWKK